MLLNFRPNLMLSYIVTDSHVHQDQLIQDVQRLSWRHHDQLSHKLHATQAALILSAHNRTGNLLLLRCFWSILLKLSFRPSSTNPPLTYLPPGPPSSYVRQSRQIDPELIKDINNLVQPGARDFHAIESSLASAQEQSIDDTEFVRKKRSISGDKEIIAITLNFKGYQFA